MVVKNKYSKKETSFKHFRTWESTVKNKQDYVVLDWGDLIMAQQYQKDGSLKDLYVMDRDHAINMCKMHEDKFRYRPLTKSDWESLRESVSDSPETVLKPNNAPSKSGQVKPPPLTSKKSNLNKESIKRDIQWFISALIAFGIFYIAYQTFKSKKYESEKDKSEIKDENLIKKSTIDTTKIN